MWARFNRYQSSRKCLFRAALYQLNFVLLAEVLFHYWGISDGIGGLRNEETKVNHRAVLKLAKFFSKTVGSYTPSKGAAVAAWRCHFTALLLKPPCASGLLAPAGLYTSACLLLVRKNSWAIQNYQPKSALSHGREPRRCLGRVFNIRLGSFVSKQCKCMAHTQPLLELKTRSMQDLQQYRLRTVGIMCNTN